MKRYGQVARLKPEKVEEYIRLHAEVWPDVLRVIEESNLKNYSIYIQSDMLFCYFEYTGDDYEGDMEKMEESSIMQEWWKHTKPCFLLHDFGEYYLGMREIFHNP